MVQCQPRSRTADTPFTSGPILKVNQTPRAGFDRLAASSADTASSVTGLAQRVQHFVRLSSQKGSSSTSAEINPGTTRSVHLEQRHYSVVVTVILFLDEPNRTNRIQTFVASGIRADQLLSKCGVRCRDGGWYQLNGGVICRFFDFPDQLGSGLVVRSIVRGDHEHRCRGMGPARCQGFGAPAPKLESLLTANVEEKGGSGLLQAAGRESSINGTVISSGSKDSIRRSITFGDLVVFSHMNEYGFCWEGSSSIGPSRDVCISTPDEPGCSDMPSLKNSLDVPLHEF